MLSLRRVFVTIATLSLLFTATCTLFAAPGDEAGQLSPEARAAQFFAKLDTDGDGKVSREEFPGNDEKFARVDANGDGFITPDEMAGRGGNQGRVGGQQANPQQRWNAMLERFDTDGDGAISAEEFEGPEQVFKALDQDEDGKITQEEALRMANRGGEGQAGGGAEGNRWQRLLRSSDRDGDGAISREEWLGRPEGFARFDRDGDGVISAEEGAQIGAGREGQPAERMDPAQTLLRMMDKNGDGQASAEEWQNFFEAADVNADERLSRDELMKQFQDALRPPAPAPVEGN